MGPSKAIGSLPQLQMHWAHAMALTGPVPNALGPNETIGTMLLYYDSRPIRNIRPLSLDGPMWASPSSSVKLHMVLIYYYDKILVHYVFRLGDRAVHAG